METSLQADVGAKENETITSKTGVLAMLKKAVAFDESSVEDADNEEEPADGGLGCDEASGNFCKREVEDEAVDDSAALSCQICGEIASDHSQYIVIGFRVVVILQCAVSF
jgi:hypothetical protein